ncbi:hypothetical protein VNO80_29810 [Phaseolus coccineus]|uniref:Uncharacterized protein n=1 Tax=Phaseolus coccineus TaxID=3886 RepID=A0AAN9QCT5_PHACN
MAKLKLETQLEQSRLLNDIPKVIPEIGDTTLSPEGSPRIDKLEQNGLSELASGQTCNSVGHYSKHSGFAHSLNNRTDVAASNLLTRCLVHANGICAGYSLFSAVIAAMHALPLCLVLGFSFCLISICPSLVGTSNGVIRSGKVGDLSLNLLVIEGWTKKVLTYIILAAGAVSTEVLYLSENGNTATTWSSACGSFAVHGYAFGCFPGA